jgi:hypothetical protein
VSWRTGRGRQSCNRCHAELAVGASIWVGPITGVPYCAECARELFGKRQGEADTTPARETGMDSAASALSAGFEALRAKANRGLRIVERDWTGER